MQTTLVGQKTNSNMQTMGETRDPMSRDCWEDAQKLAEDYSKSMKHDFWIMFAAKPHTSIPNAIVCGWQVVPKRPPQGIVGALVFKWTHKKQKLEIDVSLSLPNDVPISDMEMSKKSCDFTPGLAKAAQASKSIILA